MSDYSIIKYGIYLAENAWNHWKNLTFMCYVCDNISDSISAFCSTSTFCSISAVSQVLVISAILCLCLFEKVSLSYGAPTPISEAFSFLFFYFRTSVLYKNYIITNKCSCQYLFPNICSFHSICGNNMLWIISLFLITP